MDARPESPPAFDYIIVGGGTAGCILANRLTESRQSSVLLIEAGPSDKNLWIHVPLGIGKTIANPGISYSFKSEPETGARGRRLAIPRGRVLGGSSSINGCVYVRGNPRDYDHWAESGATGWSYDEVLPFYRKAENFEGGGDAFRGSGGPQDISIVRTGDALLDDLLRAAEEAGYPRNPDFNGRSQEGFGFAQAIIRNGVRRSTARSYLEPARSRGNLEIAIDSQVVRVLFEGKRAVGVVCRTAGRDRVLKCRREIILAAGSVASPMLLEGSGIGDGDRLRELGIDVVHHLPGVGENLQEHFAAFLKWKITGHATVNQRVRGLRAVGEGLKYILSRKGALALSAGPVMGFVKTDPSLVDCDVQYHATPMSFESPETRRLDRYPAFTISSIALRPKSRGSIHIASKDPMRPPTIVFNAFSNEYDLKTIANGMRIARKIVGSPALRRYQPMEQGPAQHLDDDAALFDYIRTFGNAAMHPVGTCRMGSDPGAVVDPSLRVIGVEGLRVADASIMPAITSGNTMAPSIMIGEKAAALIEGSK
jgi:choline dehydrogenase